MRPDVVPEQGKDDSNMDSLDLLMMLGYIAENNITIFYPLCRQLFQFFNLSNDLKSSYIVEVIKNGLNKTAVIVFGLHETGIDLAHKLTFLFTLLKPYFYLLSSDNKCF